MELRAHEMGDSSRPAKLFSFCLARSDARIRGLENLLCFTPGACALGFMLPPASQAWSTFVQSVREQKLR